MRRRLKLTATALIMVLVVFLLAGCGGGEDETTQPVTRAAASNGADGSKASSKAKASAEDVSQPEMLIDQVIVPTEDSPEDFNESIEKRQPIAVTFYQLGPSDDADVRTAMNSLESRYKGQMDFYTYLYSDGERYKDLATLLLVDTTPTVVIINEESRVQRAWTGYADEDSLEQGIVEALE